MDINYIVGDADQSMATYRYRCAIPGRLLEKRGHGITIGNHHKYNDIHFYLKHFYHGALSCVANSMGESTSVFDISDDHFDGIHANFYQKMCESVDVISCTTEAMAKVIKEKTGKTAHVVYDPFELPEANPKFEGTTDLLWYGHPSNLHGLLDELPKLTGHNIRIITKPITAKGAVGSLKTILENIVPWSIDNMMQGLHECDLVIIPVDSRAKNQVKSPNRLIEAFRQGRFVVANPIPAYQEFAQWAYLGDIAEGIQWARDNKELITGRIRACQEYIEKNYAPNKIADQWENLFTSKCST